MRIANPPIDDIECSVKEVRSDPSLSHVDELIGYDMNRRQNY